MASAIVSHQCSKCKDAVGSFNCAGCKEIFCVKHSVEHRQELCAKFEQLMSEQNIVLQELQDKEPRDEALKKDFRRRIDEWKNAMIEKVCQRAEEINEQVDELIDVKNEMMIDNIRSLTNEIHTRHEKEDFFEHDIDRIKQNIKEVQQTIDKSIQQPDIELYIEPNEKIDWENLIYITEKSNSASSSVTKKQNTDKDKNGSRNIMSSNINPHPSSNPWYMPCSPSMFLPTEKSNSASSSVTNKQNTDKDNNGSRNIMSWNINQCDYSIGPSYYMPYVPPPYRIMRDIQTVNPAFIPIIRPINGQNSTINLPNQTAKREKKPLLIVDPDHRPVELQTSSILTDNNHQNSSQTASANATSSASSSDLPS